MGCAFFLISLLATVQFVIFENAGALNEELEAQGGGISSLGVLTMGNLGEGQVLCERVSEGETLKLFCNEGQVIGGSGFSPLFATYKIKHGYDDISNPMC